MVGSITDTTYPLVRFKDSDVVLMQSEHVLGYDVHDADAEKIGEVDDLIVDLESGHVRFLVIGDGGLFGIGRNHYVVPVDIVAEVIADSPTPTVFLGVAGVVVAESPWDGRMDRASLAATYRHFDCEPYWADGYVERDWSASPA